MKIKELNSWILKDLIKRNGWLSILDEEDLKSSKDKIDYFIETNENISKSVRNYLSTLKYGTDEYRSGSLYSILYDEILLESMDSTNFNLNKLMVTNLKIESFNKNLSSNMQILSKYYNALKYSNESNKNIVQACSEWAKVSLLHRVEGFEYDSMCEFCLEDLVNSLMPFEIKEFNWYEDKKYKLITDEEKLDLAGDAFICEELREIINNFLIENDGSDEYEEYVEEYFQDYMSLNPHIDLENDCFENKRKLDESQNKVLNQLLKYLCDLKVVTVSFEKDVNMSDLKLIREIRCMLEFIFNGILGISNGFVNIEEGKLIFVIMKDVRQEEVSMEMCIEEYIEEEMENLKPLAKSLNKINTLIRGKNII